MATIWHKQLRSMRHDRALPPNEQTVTFVYRCWVEATEGESTVWDPFTYALNVEDDLDLPRAGQTVADWDASLSGTWADYFRFRHVNWVSVDDGISVFDGTFTATSMEIFCPEPTILRQDQTERRRVELYRNANPTAASDAGTAISSTNYADIEASRDSVTSPRSRSSCSCDGTRPWWWPGPTATRTWLTPRTS